MALISNTDDATSLVEGTGVLSSGVETFEAAFSGDLAEFGANAAGFAFDALATIGDPFGELFSAGLGWLMEHLWGLKDLFDMLAGDPDAIKETIDDLMKVSAELKAAVTERGEQLARDLREWEGEARTAFDGSMDAIDKRILIHAEAAAVHAETIGGVANVIAVVRELLRDAIADLALWIIGLITAGTAFSVVTFGASMATAVTTAVTQVCAKVAEWAPKIGKLVNLLTKIAEWIGKHKILAYFPKYFIETGKKYAKDEFSPENVAAERNEERT